MILSAEPAGSGLQGEITPPGDKSISHRALIFSSLAAGRSELSGLLESEDTLATLRACEQLGAVVERGGKSFCHRHRRYFQATIQRASGYGQLGHGNASVGGYIKWAKFQQYIKR